VILSCSSFCSFASSSDKGTKGGERLEARDVEEACFVLVDLGLDVRKVVGCIEGRGRR